eukprot:scaffold82055_cov29-Prasinocladus_malaysianus.AAC.2
MALPAACALVCGPSRADGTGGGDGLGRLGGSIMLAGGWDDRLLAGILPSPLSLSLSDKSTCRK